ERLALSGNGINGSGAFLNVSGSNTWGGPIDLVVAPAFSPSTFPAGTTSIGVTGSTDTLSLTGAISENNTTSSPTGAIATGRVKLGPGTLVLGGTNPYSGGTYVTKGTLRVTNKDALGTASTNEIQRVSVTGTSGTWNLTYKGQTTIPAFAVGASANTVRAGL